MATGKALDGNICGKSAVVALFMLAAATACHSSAAVFDVRKYGARGDGVAKDTAAIQAAVDAASAAGGGTVEFAPSAALRQRSKGAPRIAPASRLTSFGGYRFGFRSPQISGRLPK